MTPDFCLLCSQRLRGIHCFPRSKLLKEWHLWHLLFLRSPVKIMEKQNYHGGEQGSEWYVGSSGSITVPLGQSSLLPSSAPPHTHLSPLLSQTPTRPCSFRPPLFGLGPAVVEWGVSLSPKTRSCPGCLGCAQCRLRGWVGQRSGYRRRHEKSSSRGRDTVHQRYEEGPKMTDMSGRISGFPKC